jgi:hypothetical protein
VRISAPGEVERLRSAVQAADPGRYWKEYLDTLLSFVPQAEPEHNADPGPPGLEPTSR